MLVRHTDPFRDLAAMHHRLDSLFNGVFRGAGDADSSDASNFSEWVPALDVIERDDSYVLRAELPGMSENDVEVTLENNQLTIRGMKQSRLDEQEGTFRRVESRYGRFYRTVTLPTLVDHDRIEASFDKGVLEVLVPKAEQAKPKQITVKVS